jgi:hypothetical protein
LRHPQIESECSLDDIDARISGDPPETDLDAPITEALEVREIDGCRAVSRVPRNRPIDGFLAGSGAGS